MLLIPVSADSRVEQGDAGVGVGCGIEQHRMRAFGLGFVQPVDEMALVVGLAHVDLAIEVPRAVFQHGGDVVERVAAVDLRLAQAEQVQVRPVEHIDQPFRHVPPFFSLPFQPG